MIVGELKPIEEIVSTISGLKKVMVVGCGGCVTVCLSGGDKQARSLALELVRPKYYDDSPPTFKVETIQRQCEPDWLNDYFKIPDDIDAALSMACGAGVQTLAAAFDPLPVIPALNTTFLGATHERGVFHEMCKGCGDCVLAFTGGICPVTQCAKSLFNGPCGGSGGGTCEVSDDIPCAWTLIYRRLKAQNKLHFMTRTSPPRDWRTAGGSGPRRLVNVTSL